LRIIRKSGAAILAVLVLASGIASGCAQKGGPSSPRERSMQSTFEGNYQVKGVEDGKARGVGLYASGSFRIIVEGTPRMVIYNEETGEGWLVSLAQKTYEPISRDEALLKAGFMPDLVMKPYFDLEQFWEGAEFRMDTADGRSIRAFLEGPDYLPSAWVVEARGKPFKVMKWEYRRVGGVSPANFQLPDGLTPG
jgi:hypothetical protein